MSTTANTILDNTQDLKRIAIAIEAWIAMQPRGPEWEFPASQLTDFDWPDIGAQVLALDDRGATQVSWMYHTWTRSDFGSDAVFQRDVDHKTRAILAVFSPGKDPVKPSISGRS